MDEPQQDRLLHERSITFRGYRRGAGRWVVEGRLTDTRAYPYQDYERGLRQPGEPVHLISVGLVFDDAFTILEVNTAMREVPYAYCSGAADPMQGLAGRSLGPGWRRAVNEVLGGTRGCAHIRELLYGMATAAIQTVMPYREVFEQAPRDPFAIGSCHSLAADSPVVARFYPGAHRPRQPGGAGR